MFVVDSIAEATRYNRWRDRDVRNPNILTAQVLHRISLSRRAPSPIPDRALTVGALAHFFSDPAQKTEGFFPYHFLIEPTGIIHQCLPVGVVGLAAGTLNRNGLQIACIGDFRKEPPTTVQMRALHELSRLFYQNGVRDITGHSGPGTSADPNKVCPGEHLNPTALLLEIRDYWTEQYKGALTLQGVRF